MADLDLSLALDVARRAVTAAAEAAMRHFRTDLAIETKPDRSPVTAADRESESRILAVVRGAFPDHAILTEESGLHAGSERTRWIVDPLDGTRGFSRGATFWGPLVACEHEGEIVAGAMAMPALGATFFAARGMGTYRTDGSTPKGTRLRVSSVSSWSDSTLQLGEVRALLEPPHGPGVLALAREAASTRAFGDLAGCAAVLEGRAEAWLEAGVQVWDLAPHRILLEEAGGRFTDFEGRVSIASGRAAGTNGRVHAHVLAMLQRG